MVEFAVVLGLVTILFLLFRYRPESMIEDWARANGVEVVKVEQPRLWKGPYTWHSSNKQFVFRLLVRDSEGRLRHCWMRCGGWVLGTLSKDVDVTWEEDE